MSQITKNTKTKPVAKMTKLPKIIDNIKNKVRKDSHTRKKKQFKSVIRNNNQKDNN